MGMKNIFVCQIQPTLYFMSRVMLLLHAVQFNSVTWYCCCFNSVQ